MRRLALVAAFAPRTLGLGVLPGCVGVCEEVLWAKRLAKFERKRVKTKANGLKWGDGWERSPLPTRFGYSRG